MENAMHIAAVLGPVYLVVGLSLLFYADAWQKMVREWEKNHYVLIMGAYMALILGLVVINMYNVWAWNVWLIVTITGWCALAKGVFYFLAPGDWTKALFKQCNNLNWLYFWSLVIIVAGAALSYQVYLV